LCNSLIAMRRTNERCCESVALHGERLLHYCAGGPKAVIYWRKKSRNVHVAHRYIALSSNFMAFALNQTFSARHQARRAA
ncbi:hypothetical protein, partial [Pseudomonas aeruginosa]|uniref:hypothetical protein n=1 Tax=Pseudomonas aeruginosa TaxID=287 RepID=UPI0027C5F8B0